MQLFLDRLASIFAAIVTCIICGGPVWFTVQAVRADVAPVWAYGFAAALAGIGLILAIAFLRKAAQGVAPTRMRKRRSSR